MSRKDLQELIKNLHEFYKCPACETNYYLDDIKFLGQIDSYCFLQLTCHDCSLPVLATFSGDGKVVGRQKSDLKRGEEAKFAAKGAISAGEIAEFHRFLGSYRGDLSHLT